ncbi:iron-containing alcohol dehydrogenase [Amycolatopsis sp. FDAARGOS 1241]|uniref:iron-containing alcohol dehydrogenase n=1 Tax=Amycolatopsis sp. FDAARGOS 1241 TaxID=2778070 RepID=UPI001950ED8E|nr:iron-containing alcohol dehydrogenase [Amycolatopsis sp. FDAARGOS 1241]QRP47203.1 iron-containing alcohol dehydrogenase [Amycolatopsis sp. FDAARGOS 1241]
MALTAELVTQPATQQELIWGSGSLDRVPKLLEALDCRRVLAVGSGSVDAVIARLPGLLGRCYLGRWSDVPAHVPAHQVNLAVGSAQETHADSVLAIGGGSAIGMGKIIALALRLPLIAVPTTFAGAERTSRYHVTTERGKETGTSGRALPRAVVYDPVLVAGLPPAVVASSGITAVAHCVEVLCHDAGEEAWSSAREGLLLLWGSLPVLSAGAGGPGNWLDALAGASQAGRALEVLGAPGAVHEASDLLSVRSGLGHGLAQALLLPRALGARGEASALARSALAELRPGVGAEQALGEFAAALGLVEPPGVLAVPVAAKAWSEALAHLSTVSRRPPLGSGDGG